MLHKKFERLLLFKAVAETLSFSESANKIGVSRGHLSQQVKQLEKELSVKLLSRSTRHVSLTQEGKNVLASVQKISGAIDQLEDSLHTEQNQLVGNIRITAPNLFSHSVLAPLCYDFNQRHNKVTFNLDTSYTTKDLNQEHFDVAFRSTNTPPQDMVAKPLLRYNHHIVASPDYVEKFGYPDTLEDLATHQCLTGPDQSSWPFSRRKVPINGWLKLNDNVSLIHHVLTGRGIARLPNYAVAPLLEQNQLVTLLDNENTALHTLYVLHPPRLKQSKRLSTFLDFVQSEVQNFR
jgi:DNA-binding transcriptional LysR family regulator